jgi:2-desacetyl-2-hydroxyethyl bacteriochlorophyllide A dehydrogenase
VVVRQDLPPPSPGPGEALVQVRLAGICSTDLELVRGYYPFVGIIGHEFVGEVIAAAEAAPVGARVVGEINAACGSCATCRAGRPRHCPQRTVLGVRGRHGAFAEQLVLPARNLHRVPAHVADEAAVFVEPLAAALRVLEQVPIGRGDRVLLVGAGRLGQLVARVLARTGCTLAVVARHARQRALVTACGCTCVSEEEVAPGEHDVVVEATGVPEGFHLARRAVRPGGTIVLKSTYRGRLELDASSLAVDEITVVGSRCGPFAPALGLLERHELDPRDLVEARYPLAEAAAALRRADQRGVMKVLLECPATSRRG